MNNKNKIHKLINELLNEENKSSSVSPKIIKYKKETLFENVEYMLNELFENIEKEARAYNFPDSDLYYTLEKQPSDEGWYYPTIHSFHCHLEDDKLRFYAGHYGDPFESFELFSFNILTKDILGGTVFEEFLEGKNEIEFVDNGNIWDDIIDPQENKVASNIAKKLLEEMEKLAETDEDFHFGKESYKMIVNFINKYSSGHTPTPYSSII